MREPAARIDAVQLALLHLLELGEDLPVAERNGGNPVHRPDLHDLVDGARTRPIGDGLENVRASTIREGLQRVVVCQVGTFDHFEEGLPLRHRDGRHPDVAVAAGFDARGHRVGRTPALATGHAGRDGGVTDERDGQALQGRDVHEVAEARASTRRQRADARPGPRRFRPTTRPARPPRPAGGLRHCRGCAGSPRGLGSGTPMTVPRRAGR